jgi:enediyne biosynthesis protein E4
VLESLPADQRYTIQEPSTPKAAALPKPHLSPAVETAPTAAAAVAGLAGPSASAVRPLYAEISRAPEINLSLMAREAKIDELSQQPLLPLRQNRRGPFLAVGDLDGDGRADFALGGTTLDPLRLGLAKASGFEVRPLAGVGLAAADDGPLALFDADGDGDSDLLVTRGGVALPPGAPEFQPLLYLNDGHARFTAEPAGALPEFRVSAGAAAVGDVNNDGRPDVFIGGRVVPGQYPQTPPSALWLNRGGRFEDATDAFAPELRTVGLVTAALWVDLDADGWRDLVLALELGQVKCFSV